MKDYDEKLVVTMNYTNWKNETALRKIIPVEIWFGITEWHKEEQWLLKAYDIDKQDYRDFSMKDILSWKK